MQAPAPLPTARGGHDVHALVRVQGRTIAIAGRHVRQAVEATRALVPVPRRAGAIAGVMTLGDRVLPVVDLAMWLAPPAEATASGVPSRQNGLVLLLQDGDRGIGLAIEAVVGAQRVRSAQVSRLFHDDDPEELFQSAVLLEGDPVPVNILEPQRLMALAGVWAADADLQATDTRSDDRASPGPRVATVPHATFRIADAHVAVPASRVGELLRRPPMRKDLPARDGVLGLCEWRERLVPVVDLTGLLHAMPAGDAAEWVCIVCEDDLAIGLVVHEVLALASLAPDAGTPADVAIEGHAVVARRLVDDARTLQVIDVTALLQRCTETAISRKGARAAQLRTTADPSAPPYMVFDAGGMFAATIDGVQEVVPLPESLRPRLEAGLSTTLQWRGQAVPVLAIADDLVRLPSEAARQLIIVREGTRVTALAIAGVKALVPRGVALRSRMRLQRRTVDVISVETDARRASFTVVDLGGAAAVTAP